MVMHQFKKISVFLVLSTNILASESRTCYRNEHCDDEQVCVSYTGCQKKQVRRCLNRTCYRNGVDCPSDVFCNNKHCANYNCAIK